LGAFGLVPSSGRPHTVVAGFAATQNSFSSPIDKIRYRVYNFSETTYRVVT
jgi:hypothetical protein